MPRFASPKFADMHFVYDFCDGNLLTVLRKCQHWYPDWRRSYQRVFKMVHCNWRETGTLMPMHLLPMKDSTCKYVSDIVRNKTINEHSWHFFCSRTFSECRMIYTAWKSVVSFLYITSTEVAARGEISLSPALAVGAHPSVSVPCIVDWQGSMYKKWYI
jgi:hypothetical protein